MTKKMNSGLAGLNGRDRAGIARREGYKPRQGSTARETTPYAAIAPEFLAV